MKAYDESGKEISYNFNQETGEIEFNSTPATITYNYVTGFENVLMDVKASSNENDDENENSYESDGCNFGFSVVALALLLFVLPLKKKFIKIPQD